jgi:ABC-type uncharacterized transport system substrate-binding protein
LTAQPSAWRNPATPMLKLVGVIVALVILAVPLAAEASAKVWRIGYLATGFLESREARLMIDTFRQGLRERGYVENENVAVEYRAADRKIERFPDLAAELVRLKVDLIFAPSSPAARAAHQATATIPVVSFAMGDPVGDGLVASLSRPGGNVTGLTFLGPQLVPKRLELLREVLPKVPRVAALWHAGAFSESTTRDMLKQAETAARTLGVELQLVRVRGPDEFDRAFTTMTTARSEALVTFPSTMIFDERRRLVDLAAKHRLPAMFNAREFVELGGLMAYGADIVDLCRRATTYVDRILKGAKPADLPVEQPTKFELAINMRTAKTLGLTIPQSLLLRADEIIQ